MAKKSGFRKAVDKVLHPGHEEDLEGQDHEIQPHDEEGEAGTLATVHAPASPPRGVKKAGKADPAEDFKTHPKFAKFKGRA